MADAIVNGKAVRVEGGNYELIEENRTFVCHRCDHTWEMPFGIGRPERCDACGQCALDYTGGICPVTACAKSLLNGPCGGTKEGKCEVDSEKDCGWQLIYERLEKLGRLENLKKAYAARDHSKMLPSEDLRQTSFYDLER